MHFYTFKGIILCIFCLYFTFSSNRETLFLFFCTKIFICKIFISNAIHFESTVCLKMFFFFFFLILKNKDQVYNFWDKYFTGASSNFDNSLAVTRLHQPKKLIHLASCLYLFVTFQVRLSETA